MFLQAKLAVAMLTLVPSSQTAPEPSAQNWPLWLRILAVAAALVFVQLVARSVRKGADTRDSEPPPGNQDK
jgi:hypothetical protein